MEKLSNNAAAPAAKIPTLNATGTKAVANPLFQYNTFPSFSCDQDNEKAKIYMSLEGVDQEKIEVDFKAMSIDIKFHEVQGKNYRYAIPNLHEEIVPEKCKLIVKPQLGLSSHWLKPPKKTGWTCISKKIRRDKEHDPMSGVMDLMKNMYEEGDVEMKKTIAKAWTYARSGKATNSVMGYNR